MFGKRLRELRKKKGLTMKELGNRFSLAESTISGYEGGSRKPDMELLNKFADYFEVTTDYLLGRTDDPNGKIEKKSDEIEGFFGFDIESLSEEEIEELKSQLKKEVEFYLWKKKSES